MDSQARRRQLEEMLAADPRDAELQYMLAMEYISQGDDAGAVGRFEEMFRIVPDYPHAYHQAGRTLARLGRIEQARTVLQRGIPIALSKGDQHAAGEMQELLSSLE